MLATVGFIDLIGWTLLAAFMLLAIFSAPEWIQQSGLREWFNDIFATKWTQDELVPKIEEADVEALCPFCKDDISSAKESECSSCSTIFHKECYKEFGKKCPTIGCRGKRKKVRA